MYPEVDFLYLNEQEMIKAGVKNMPKCIDTMEDVLKCLTKGDFVMGAPLFQYRRQRGVAVRSCLAEGGYLYR